MQLSSSALTSFLLLSVVSTGRSQLSIGDSCRIDGISGVCSLLPKCLPIYNELLAGNPPSQLCGFRNFDPIVCCPTNTASVTPRPTTTTTPIPETRIPQRPMNYDRSPAGIARAKCAEYARAVYVTELPPTLSGNAKPVNHSTCGIKSRKLIVGGTKADPKEFPHMTAIGFDSSDGILWNCGGTLVSEQYVLTAAHCTYSIDWGRAAWARVGDLNLARTDDVARPQDRRIVQRLRHPDYKRPSEYHDIALMKLERPVNFDAWVRPACLPYTLPDVAEIAIATGWGKVDWADDEGSNDLLKVTLKMVPHRSCNATFSDGTPSEQLNMGIVGDWQLCAGELGKDTCQGDSGGPLTSYNDEFDCMYTVSGITSLGRLCGSIIPGVYTRVYNYLPWLVTTMWPNEL